MNWISALGENGEPQDLRSPDGTIIEIHPDCYIVVTPDGYRVKINIWPPEFIFLSKKEN